jgi:hypothetical protein
VKGDNHAGEGSPAFRACELLLSALSAVAKGAERSPGIEVVLADGDDGARLRTLLAFPLVHVEPDFIALREIVEFSDRDRISVHIDLLSIARLDEAMVRKEPGYPAVRRGLMGFRIDPETPRIILELAACRIESITHSDEDFLVCMMFRRIAIDHDLVTRDRHGDSNMVELSLTVPAGARFDCDTAAHDIREEPVERVGTLADGRLNRRWNRHILKHDL